MLKKDLNELTNVFDLFNQNPILICGNIDKYNAMMISWGALGNLWGRHVCFIFVRKDRYTYHFSEEYQMMSLSFLEEDKHILEVFGKSSGKDIDKFKECNLHPCLDIDNNLYSIAEAKKVLKLKKIARIDLDKDKVDLAIYNEIYQDFPNHVMYICEIKQYLVGEESE